MTLNKPRKPWLAVLLSILVPGLGHIYSGNGQKGLILYLGQAIVLVSALTITVSIINLYAYIFAFCIAVSYFIYCASDAYRTAKASRYSYDIKKYNKWYIYLIIITLAKLVVHPTANHLIKENYVKAYKIPSGAMLPTILIGDHILVNRFIYNTSPPARGDIIVFEFPKNPEIDYIKRIVAIGRDTVEIKDKKLLINGIEQNEKHANHVYSKILQKESSPRDNFGPVTVPNGTVFVMGDNRDNSYDSRFWGFVKLNQIKGKAISLYWSWDKESKTVRWHRIGEPIKQDTMYNLTLNANSQKLAD